LPGTPEFLRIYVHHSSEFRELILPEFSGEQTLAQAFTFHFAASAFSILPKAWYF
jgi:hypothetical protein